MHKKQR